ncbi:hypothetical protein KSS87_018044 [Heliosperma pusillum]|nr:hypothetical protein KSS87_018044 [Heliosperma pusillum]
MPGMASSAPKNFADDVSLVVVLLDTNPYFWSSSTSLSFSALFSHVLSFVNSILLLNQLNQVVIIATGYNTCDYIFDSSVSGSVNQSSGNARMPGFCEEVIKNFDEFLSEDEKLSGSDVVDGVGSSLLSGSLSMAMCCILWSCCFMIGFSMAASSAAKSECFNYMPLASILCLHGSPDGPEQYVSVMNAIFSAQRSMIPIDSCVVGAQHSAFLQQASYITGGVYLKPQLLDGLFQYLSSVFATDLHSRNFIQLPKPVGVDFRASSVYGRAKADASSTIGQKRKDAS